MLFRIPVVLVFTRVIRPGRPTLMRVLLLMLLLCNASATTASQIYWSDSDAANIWVAEADGSEGRVLFSLPAGAEPRGIAIDPKVRCCTGRKMARIGFDGVHSMAGTCRM
jgi:hypothetical protein